jgi:hypothetical protein
LHTCKTAANIPGIDATGVNDMGLPGFFAMLAVAAAGFVGTVAAASADIFDQFKQSPSLQTLLATKPRFQWTGDGPAGIKNANVVYTAEFKYAGKDRLRLYETFTFVQPDAKTVAVVASDLALHFFSRAKVQDRAPDGYLSGNKGFKVELYCKTEQRCFDQKMMVYQTKSDGTTVVVQDSQRTWETVELRTGDQGSAQQVAYALSDLAELVRHVKD